MLRRIVAPMASLALLAGIATPAYASWCRSDLERLRQQTAKYRTVAVAERAGYAKFADVDGVTCIDMPGRGAMGVHYVNGALAGDGNIRARTPEAMVYEPDRAGRPHLVAVEYVVLRKAWTDAGHRRAPRLYGQTFDFTASPNRYGLPPFYSLHVWVWKHNPAGAFSMWNPRVHCPGRPAESHARHHS
ncbi:hypothetical protein [Paractinoplanes brasiliensis]|uniref:Uncharacterized protein n=1 Tax=Paractinoplanes brasiliensis TaxID=52695 RepID=A0A4R6JZA9_9ACTN|nr:hypothetical protein [Actinoplanes brasiliensis]TDO42129.1 hypothetical protein C8E87_5892 [Actinoplanes brasiliensis]GID32007.1 hypothetical protein Abr02nite_69900 [Actinoplanes brasiliensis]